MKSETVVIEAKDWAGMVGDLLSVGQRQIDIARAAGLTPPSIPDILLGRQKSVRWEVGDRLIRLHKLHCLAK